MHQHSAIDRRSVQCRSHLCSQYVLFLFFKQQVLNLDEIDCVGQSYFASIELWVAWEDATFDPTRPFGECWIPSVYFYNSKKHTLVTRGARTVGDHEFCGRTIRKGEAPHQWYYHIEVSAWYSEIFGNLSEILHMGFAHTPLLYHRPHMCAAEC
eukprot:SAG31_NODE_332_length_17516_cov_3.552840_6_plen_154_part_00